MECKELFHLRILLNTVKGPTCFEDLLTITDEDGNLVRECETFQEAAFHRGLIQDDREWEVALEEAVSVAMPTQIRSLFVIILIHGLPQNPKALWEKYRDHMSEDFRHKRTGRRRDSSVEDHGFTDDDYNDALLDIEKQLQAFPKSKTEDYNLPATRVPTRRGNQHGMVTEIREALNFNRVDEERKLIELTSKFNDEQSKAFEEINDSVIHDKGKCYYLDGAGGCGKTTVGKNIVTCSKITWGHNYCV